MSPGKISQRVVSERLKWIDQMIKEIKTLPLDDYASFAEDKRNIRSAESCLRRAIEALMDLGRHILAKGFGQGVSEYKEIGTFLEEFGIFNREAGDTFQTLAGYRNRMVHFYHEISNKELYEICSSQLSDISFISNFIKAWINKHPEMVNNIL